MTDDYCKLVSGIILSTIWREDDHTRILWITMLALKGRDHRVLASVPGLAAVANIPIESCRAGLVKLGAPDMDSRTKEHEGRRIKEVDGGWLVLNGEKYRNFLSKQERNEYQAKLMSERRAADKLAPVSTKLAQLGQAEAEAEAEADKTTAAEVGDLEIRASSEEDSVWMKRLSESPTYSHLNVPAQFDSMVAYYKKKNKIPTRRLFLDWLNRAERPLSDILQPARGGF